MSCADFVESSFLITGLLRVYNNHKEASLKYFRASERLYSTISTVYLLN